MFIYISAFKLWYNSINGGIKMNIGYARISTGLQNLDLQKDSLKNIIVKKYLLTICQEVKKKDLD